MSSANRSRKYDSGYQKRKRKQRIEDLTQTQKGAMDRFIIKESQVSSDNHSLDQDPAIGNNDVVNGTSIDGQTEGETNVEVDDVNTHDSFQPDIFDPRYWDSLVSKQIDILAQKGPRRDLSIQKGPRNNHSCDYCISRAELF